MNDAENLKCYLGQNLTHLILSYTLTIKQFQKLCENQNFDRLNLLYDYKIISWPETGIRLAWNIFHETLNITSTEVPFSLLYWIIRTCQKYPIHLDTLKTLMNEMYTGARYTAHTSTESKMMKSNFLLWAGENIYYIFSHWSSTIHFFSHKQKINYDKRKALLSILQL